MARRRPRDGPKMASRRPRRLQDSPKTAPRRLPVASPNELLSRWRRDGSKMAPRRPRDGPKMAPRRPRRFQDGRKTAPRWPQDAQDGSKMAPRRPRDSSQSHLRTIFSQTFLDFPQNSPKNGSRNPPGPPRNASTCNLEPNLAHPGGPLGGVRGAKNVVFFLEDYTFCYFDDSASRALSFSSLCLRQPNSLGRQGRSSSR